MCVRRFLIECICRMNPIDHLNKINYQINFQIISSRNIRCDNLYEYLKMIGLGFISSRCLLYVFLFIIPGLLKRKRLLCMPLVNVTRSILGNVVYPRNLKKRRRRRIVNQNSCAKSQVRTTNQKCATDFFQLHVKLRKTLIFPFFHLAIVFFVPTTIIVFRNSIRDIGREREREGDSQEEDEIGQQQSELFFSSFSRFFFLFLGNKKKYYLLFQCLLSIGQIFLEYTIFVL